MMKKTRIKSLIYGYEVRITGLIVKGVLNRASKRETLGLVRDQILRLSLSDVEKNQMWLFATSFYRHTIAAAQRETDPKVRAEKVYTVLRKDSPVLEHQKNEIADNIEFRIKHDEIRKIVTGENIFYYCTTHKNCAVGHQEYQGRIYVIGDWESKVGEADREAVARYIQKHKTLTVEEVTAEPVWLVTRRNCKHRLVPIATESVLKGETGDLGHIYVSRNIGYAEGQYNDYRDRLKMMENLRNVFDEFGEVPTQMKLDIKKTRKLMRSWRAEIKK